MPNENITPGSINPDNPNYIMGNNGQWVLKNTTDPGGLNDPNTFDTIEQIEEDESIEDVADTPEAVFGDLIPDETEEEKTAREERERQGAAAGEASKQVVDENVIRQNITKRFQSEIDALNRIFAEKKREETIRGQGRLGSDTAVQSRRGLIGSTFGGAQTNRVEGLNKAQQDAIASELSFETSKIMSKIRRNIAIELDNKDKARNAGADEFIKFLEGEATRSRKRIEDTIENLLSLSDEVNDQTYIELAEELGTTPENLKRLYQEGVAIAKAAEEAAAVERQVTLKPGEKVFDPATQELLFEAPEKPITLDPKDSLFAFKNQLFRHNPATDEWDLVYTAPKEDGGIKTISLDGIDYIIDEDGNLQLPDVPVPDGHDKTVLDWANQVNDGARKFSDIPSELRTDVNSVIRTLPPPKKSIDAAQKMIKDITALLKHPGLDTAVGPGGTGFFSRSRIGIGSRNAFLGDANRLVSSLALNKLIAVKSEGATFGALSDRELDVLRAAATALGTWEKTNDKGIVRGYKIPEKEFKKELNRLLTDYQKLVDEANAIPQVTTTPTDVNQDELDVILDELFGPSDFNNVDSDTNSAIGEVTLGDKTIKTNAEIAKRLRLADAAFFRDTGNHLQVNQAFRTREQQAELFKRSQAGEIGRAAPPGSSFHETGLAIDITNWKEAEKYLRKVGLKNNLADDKGHFSFGEFA